MRSKTCYLAALVVGVIGCKKPEDKPPAPKSVHTDSGPSSKPTPTPATAPVPVADPAKSFAGAFTAKDAITFLYKNAKNATWKKVASDEPSSTPSAAPAMEDVLYYDTEGADA